MAKSELIYPTINDESFEDGRGSVLTFIPDKDIKEFNIIYFNRGCTRGRHFHPDKEFYEFFLCCSGFGIFTYIDTETGTKHNLHLAKGQCVRTEPGVSHAFFSLGTETTCVALLTKRWDLAVPSAIVKDEITKTPLVS